MAEQIDTSQLFNEYRILLFSIAYRMLNSATDAEDIVQEAFVRWLQASDEEIQSPKAYLSKVVVRLCIDHLRSNSVQREVYTGPWLPEPLLTEERPELAETAILAESLSFAFLILLEKLSPLERAVFLLREIFDYSYPEIVAIVDKSESNCRQIFHRAQQHLSQQRSRFKASHEQQERMALQFMQASLNGDMQGLLQLLSDDIIFTGDSGGKVRGTAFKPVHGRENVVRGTIGALSKFYSHLQPRIKQVNGQVALVGYAGDEPQAILWLESDGLLIHRIYTIINPDKLQWLK